MPLTVATMLNSSSSSAPYREPLRRDGEPSKVGIVLTVESVGSFQRVLVAEDDLGVGRLGG